jgi:3-hexulose-6-phosphate synthase
MSCPQLQLALDFVRLDEAIALADQVAAHVDLIEAGTPLIKACGLDAVRRLKRRFPRKPVIADMKTMDTGFLEAEMAFRAGADRVTVLGAAARETIAGAAQAARQYKGAVVVDTIGIADLEALVLKIEDLDVDWLLIHTGIDQQTAGVSPFADLERVDRLAVKPGLGVVGGLGAGAMPVFRRYPKVGLVVVGGAITHARDPGRAAAEIGAALGKPPERR